jgi:hypothetical protein
MTITMIVEYVAAAAVIALFAWLVPMRRNGIPGLRGRGRPPGHAATGDAVSPPARPGRAGAVPPRPVPASEQVGEGEQVGESEQVGEGGTGSRDRQQDQRILAELDRTWDAGYADRLADRLRDRRDSA